MALKDETLITNAPFTTELFHPESGDLTYSSSYDKLVTRIDFDRTVDGYSDKTTPTTLKYVLIRRQDCIGQIVRYKKDFRYGWYHESSFTGPVKLAKVAPYEADFDYPIEKALEASVLKFYDKVKESNLNLAQDLAEIRETTRLVRSVFKFAKNFKSEMIKVVARAKRDPTKDISQLWLTYVYGLRPTLQTIHDLAMFEARKLNDKKRILVRTQARDVFTYDPTSDTDARLSVRHNYGVTRGATYQIPDNDTIQRLTSLDPTVISYELLPWSFVFDWIVDIGSYLEALESERRFSAYLSGNYLTTSYKTSAQTTYDYVQTLSSKEDRVNAYGNVEKITVERVILTAPPTAKYPRLKLPRLGYSQIGSAMALLRQAVPEVLRAVRR